MQSEELVERVARAINMAIKCEIECDVHANDMTPSELHKIARAALSAVPDEVGQIVRWLRKEAIMSTDPIRRRMNKALDQIEAGEHLK